MTNANEWTGRVGTAWAEEWRRTDRSFGALTGLLLDPRVLGDFAAALDIGCGAGELVERLSASHPSAAIAGIDIAAELLEVARARCARLPDTRFELCDAAEWSAGAHARPDLMISRHGVMFFADPVSAFASLRAQAAPGAALRFSCFRRREDNAWAAALATVLPRPQEAPDPHAPGPFAFGDPGRVEAILTAAGWRGARFEAVDYDMIAGTGEGAVDEALAYFQRIGPAARALREMPASARPAALERLRGMIAAHHDGGRVALDAAAWIVTARAPSAPPRL